MALLRQTLRSKVLPLKTTVLFAATRNAGVSINADYLPGPYPKTEEERLKAAKKYGLLPHEYKPIADDGFGYGDYPDLPHIGAESKDPFYPWDYPEYRKNYGETWHINSDIYGEDKFDPQKDWRVSRTAMIGSLVGMLSGCAFLVWCLSPYPFHRPACAKQYPYKGRTHYSFDRPN